MLHLLINFKPKTLQSYLVTSAILHPGRKKIDKSDMPKSQRTHDKCIKIFCDGICIFPWVLYMTGIGFVLLLFLGTRKRGEAMFCKCEMLYEL